MRSIFMLVVLAYASALTATPMLEAHEVRGQIVHAVTKAPLEYATISAFDPDSTLVDGTITDAEGRFQLQLEKGTYRFRVEFIGFVAQEQELDVTGNLDLGTINLGEDVVALDAVEVTADKSQLNLQLDKKVFNVGQDLASRGGSANQVLENVPSVSVGADGTISLRGNTGVRVLINGRPSALADNNALSAIPASSIERVEVITNPSARYEAAGNAGIINIVLKRDRDFGFNGSAMLATGSPADHQAGFNFNLRKDKWNVFGNVGARYSDFEGRGNSLRENFTEGLPPFIEQDFKSNRNDKAAWGFAGLEYYLNENKTLTASYSYFGINNTDQTRTNLEYFDEDRHIDQQWQQVLDYDEPESYNQLDVTFTNDNQETGKKWVVTFQHDFWFNLETENTQLDQVVPQPLEIYQLRTITDESSKDYLLQTDYQLPLGETGQLEMGIRGETRVIVSDYIAETREGDTWQVYLGLDNRLDYFERIGGAYLQYGNQFGKLKYLLGLRSEYTHVRAENEVDPDNVIDKTYTRFFPTANFSYSLPDNASAQLSYSRRIRRPSFWQLNPFRGIQDPNEIFRGNPDMDPAYTDRLELTYLRNWEKLTLNPSIYYSSTRDYFEFYITQEADGLVVTSPINLDREQSLGLELTVNYRPTDWLNIYGEFNYFEFEQEGIFGDRDFAFSGDNWQAGSRVQVTPGGGWSFQGSVDYRAAIRNAQQLSKAVVFADFAFAKKLFDDRLTVTLNVRNAFDSQFFGSRIATANFVQEGGTAWNTRRYGLTLNYRIQKGMKLGQREARGSIR